MGKFSDGTASDFPLDMMWPVAHRRHGDGKGGEMQSMAEQAAANEGMVNGGHRHQDAVIEALTVPTRVLIGAVLVVNFSLGLWLVRQSDFSDVKPQGSADVQAKSTSAPESKPLLGDGPVPISTQAPMRLPSAPKVALNEAN